MREDQVDFILSKMLSGEATPEEIEKLRQWRDSSKANAVLYRHFVALGNAHKNHQKSRGRDEVFKKTWLKARKESVKHFLNLRHSGLKIAASIVLISLLGLLVHNLVWDGQNVGGKITYVVKHNATGQKSKIFLPDGSDVWLNSESSIKYSKGFKGGNRTLWLKGEAYFSVKKDISKPFIVISGKVHVTALGTRFNVNAFGDNTVAVALEEGKVNVEFLNGTKNKKNQSMILMPGEMAQVHTADNQIIKTSFDKNAITGWRHGLLFFQQANFNEIIGKLQRWYGVKFLYEGRPQKDWNFSGSFKHEYLDNVLATLAFSENFKYEIIGDTVKVKFK